MDGREFSYVVDSWEISYSNTQGYFTTDLGDGWINRMDNRHTDGWRWMEEVSGGITFQLTDRQVM